MLGLKSTAVLLDVSLPLGSTEFTGGSSYWRTKDRTDLISALTSTVSTSS